MYNNFLIFVLNFFSCFYFKIKQVEQLSTFQIMDSLKNRYNFFLISNFIMPYYLFRSIRGVAEFQLIPRH